MTHGQRRASTRSTTAARASLIAATSSLLASGGPSAATSRAIAAHAGENLSAITYYFGSKENLISSALMTTARSIVAPVVDALTNQDSAPADKLFRAIEMLYRALDEHESRLTGYLQSLATSCHNEELRVEIHDLHRGLVRVLEDEMTRQQAGGLIPDWVQPLAMAQLIVALGNGVAVGVATDPDATDPVAVGSQFAQLLLSVRPEP